jgi:hypothetical protein
LEIVLGDEMLKNLLKNNLVFEDNDVKFNEEKKKELLRERRNIVKNLRKEMKGKFEMKCIRKSFYLC